MRDVLLEYCSTALKSKASFDVIPITFFGKFWDHLWSLYPIRYLPRVVWHDQMSLIGLHIIHHPLLYICVPQRLWEETPSIVEFKSRNVLFTTGIAMSPFFVSGSLLLLMIWRWMDVVLLIPLTFECLLIRNKTHNTHGMVTIPEIIAIQRFSMDLLTEESQGSNKIWRFLWGISSDMDYSGILMENDFKLQTLNF